MCVLTTGLAFFNPCEILEFPNRNHSSKQPKHVSHPQDLCHSAAFRIGEQRFFPGNSGDDDESQDLEYEIDLRSSPIEEFFVTANVILVVDNDSRNDLEVLLEEIYHID